MSKLSMWMGAFALAGVVASIARAGESPAARSGDMHACPMVVGLVPHVGGPIGPGSLNVLIGGLPAAREGDMLVCVGAPDSIARGSRSVLINGKGAARLGSSTAHGGSVTTGFPNVLIGD